MVLYVAQIAKAKPGTFSPPPKTWQMWQWKGEGYHASCDKAPSLHEIVEKGRRMGDLKMTPPPEKSSADAYVLNTL